MTKAKEPIRTQTRPAATRKGMVVGYKRVSALDQTDLRQLDGVETDKLFTDKASGKDTNRSRPASSAASSAKATPSSVTPWTDWPAT